MKKQLLRLHSISRITILICLISLLLGSEVVSTVSLAVLGIFGIVKFFSATEKGGAFD